MKSLPWFDRKFALDAPEWMFPNVVERLRGTPARVEARLRGLPDELEESQIGASALHPRLKQPMRVLDLAFFVAEHDDHHLATITRILQAS